METNIRTRRSTSSNVRISERSSHGSHPPHRAPAPPEREDRGPPEPRKPLRRHAVLAAEVAAIRHGAPKAPDLSAMPVEERLAHPPQGTDPSVLVDALCAAAAAGA